MLRLIPLSRFSLCLLLALTPLSHLHAHAVVTASSLQSHPVKPGHPTTVQLHFNSGVELPLSRIFLVSKGDIYRPIEPLAGKEPGEVLVPLPALPEGEYAIKYKIFAADGHLTESVIRFAVQSTTHSR